MTLMTNIVFCEDMMRSKLFWFWISLLAGMGTTCAFAQPHPATAQSAYTIDNCVKSFSMTDTVRTAAGYQYWFADKNFADGKTLKLSVVAPHSATHPPHTHGEDEFFFVLEGKAECSLAGKTRVIGPMSSFYCPSNVEHGIRNAGDTELKYLVIKKYEKN
jgi:mannose-6-phosphate isomerase-like protein (cupin superfamily)